jgi:hypothetical protein
VRGGGTNLHDDGVAIFSKDEEDNELVRQEEELAGKKSIPLQVMDRLQGIIFAPQVPDELFVSRAS